MLDVQRSVLNEEDQFWNMIRATARFGVDFKSGLQFINSLNKDHRSYRQLARNLTSTAPAWNASEKLSKTSLTNPQGLPHYPLPKLEDTMSKYLRTIQPFLTVEQLSKSEKLSKEFTEKIGKPLHEVLAKKAANEENWLAEWWKKVAYLTFRESVVVNSNPGLYFPKRHFTHDHDMIKYVAKVIWSTLAFKDRVDAKGIPIEKWGKAELDMQQYGLILGTTRIPVKNCDRNEYYPNSDYIVVAYRNGFYKVPVYYENTKYKLTEEEIVEQLNCILRSGEKDDPPIGVLSAEHRDTLAEAYERLIEDKSNRESMDCINKSLFLVCLDKFVPMIDGPTNTGSHQLIHGGGSKQNSGNRWFNKTLQYIINENGLNGLCYEHSPAEGQPIALLSDFVLNHVKNTDIGCIRETGDSVKIALPNKLNFNLSAQTLQDIKNAEIFIDKLSSNLDMNVVHFRAYGKHFIKIQKMSPDSYLQIAMQLAFYRLHKVPGGHYETAQQRIFIHGRTETIRSCSIESIAFARTMDDAQADINTKIKALRDAVEAHKKYTIEAMSGKGVDRHLLGLKLVAIENNQPVPDLYKDDGYTMSTNFRISTSQVASKYESFMCYGPAVDDGYGLCYNPRDNDVLMAISAFKLNSETSAKRMGDAMCEALENMHELLCSGGEKPKSKI